MAFDPKTLWESFIGGWGSTGAVGQGQDITNDRLVDFYDEVVGPAAGAGDKQFGTDYKKYMAGTTTSGFDTEGLEQAERDFRLAIGDPYSTGYDPFAWERISRMTGDQAQEVLKTRLYGQEERLGGTIGTPHQTGITEELESYTTGIREQREALDPTALTAGQSLQSGTSGAVLRSGTAITQSEDILAEAYKGKKELGADYKAGKDILEKGTQSSLDTALTKYLNAVNTEKQDWFDSIMGDINRAGHPTSGLGESGDYFAGDDEFTDWGDEYEHWDSTWWDEYGEPGERISVGGGGTYQMRDTGACGIGELWDEKEGKCVAAEDIDLVKDQYNLLCAPEDMDECGVCGGDGSSCAEPEPVFDQALMDQTSGTFTDYVGEAMSDEWVSDEEHAEVLRLAGEIPLGNMAANYGENWKNLINENYEKKYGYKFGEEPEDQSENLPPAAAACLEMGGRWEDGQCFLIETSDSADTNTTGNNTGFTETVVTPSPGSSKSGSGKKPSPGRGDIGHRGQTVMEKQQELKTLGRSSTPSESWDPSLEEPEESATPMLDFSNFKFPSLNLDLGFNKMPQYSKAQIEGIQNISKPFSFFGQGRKKRRRGGR